MEYRYKPEGVCSRELVFDIEGDIVKSVKVVGGCPGNTVGISKLVEGMKIKDIIKSYCVNRNIISIRHNTKN